tara:strand:+ start:15967 stop:17154 length:1188 start_codon:yes stop_codon:yes gene_type:complete
MKRFPANCPEWLQKKFLKNGGTISFHEYMNIVLNDSLEGYYGSGKAKLGIKGDFVTSPSMSDDFSFFLAMQIMQWVKQILNGLKVNKTLTILEFGSGDASLIKGIIDYFFKNEKNILQKVSFVLIEINKGMIDKQRDNLSDFIDKGVDISWSDFNDLGDQSINGIIIAHEVLDAFPVERIQYLNGHIYRQGISFIEEKGYLTTQSIPLNEEIKEYLIYLKETIGVCLPPQDAPEGWATELHINNSGWLKRVYEKFNKGILLIIDYAIESSKYYSKNKFDGTLLSYRAQVATSDFLQDPGDSDITAHLCSDVLINQAKSKGFKFLGLIKQGEALLSLGLSQKLYEIQDSYQNDLSKALHKREALLRLVDPVCLGDLKWFIFQKTSGTKKFDSKCIC